MSSTVIVVGVFTYVTVLPATNVIEVSRIESGFSQKHTVRLSGQAEWRAIVIHERASRAGKIVIRLIHKACLLFALANQLIVDRYR